MADEVHCNPQTDPLDTAALERWVRHYRHRVQAVCLHRLGDRADAEDAVQEVFLKLYKSSDTIHGNLEGWLVRCARNTCVDIIRSRHRRHQRELLVGRQHREDHPPYHQMDTCEFVQCLLARLSARDAELLTRHVVEGVSQRQLAMDHNVSQQAIADRISRIKKHLRHWSRQYLGKLTWGGAAASVLGRWNASLRAAVFWSTSTARTYCTQLADIVEPAKTVTTGTMLAIGLIITGDAPTAPDAAPQRIRQTTSMAAPTCARIASAQPKPASNSSTRSFYRTGNLGFNRRYQPVAIDLPTHAWFAATTTSSMSFAPGTNDASSSPAPWRDMPPQAQAAATVFNSPVITLAIQTDRESDSSQDQTRERDAAGESDRHPLNSRLPLRRGLETHPPRLMVRLQDELRPGAEITPWPFSTRAAFPDAGTADPDATYFRPIFTSAHFLPRGPMAPGFGSTALARDMRRPTYSDVPFAPFDRLVANPVFTRLPAEVDVAPVVGAPVRFTRSWQASGATSDFDNRMLADAIDSWASSPRHRILKSIAPTHVIRPGHVPTAPIALSPSNMSLPANVAAFPLQPELSERVAAGAANAPTLAASFAASYLPVASTTIMPKLTGQITDDIYNTDQIALSDAVIDASFKSPRGSEVYLDGVNVFNGPASGAANLLGGGTAVYNDIHSPGDSPAWLSIDGNVVYTPGSLLKIELAGIEPGQYDSLHITGDLTLSGRLDVVLLDNFQPMAGQHFRILQADSMLTGQFSNFAEGQTIDLPTPRPSSLQITYQVLDGHAVELIAVPTPHSLAVLVVLAPWLTTRWRVSQGCM